LFRQAQTRHIAITPPLLTTPLRDDGSTTPKTTAIMDGDLLVAAYFFTLVTNSERDPITYSGTALRVSVTNTCILQALSS
jgi:hypothetical protein